MAGHRVFPATIVSFATLSSEIDLGQAWDYVHLLVPAMTSNSTAYVQASEQAGGTFRRIVNKDPASAAASVDFMILSSCTNRIIPVPGAAGHRYVKVETDVVLSFTAGFKIICGGY